MMESLSESSDDFSEYIASDWIPLGEVEYDSILAFNSDKENVLANDKNQDSNVNIILRPNVYDSRQCSMKFIYLLTPIRDKVQ